MFHDLLEIWSPRTTDWAGPPADVPGLLEIRSPRTTDWAGPPADVPGLLEIRSPRTTDWAEHREAGRQAGTA